MREMPEQALGFLLNEVTELRRELAESWRSSRVSGFCFKVKPWLVRRS
jgi:hypothetical protein